MEITWAVWGGRGEESPKRLYKAPTAFTKPQKDNRKPRQTLQSPRQTIQSPDRLYKAPIDYTKPPKDYRNLLNIRQNFNILDKYPTC